MLVCLILWAATGTVPLLFAAVLAAFVCSTAGCGDIDPCTPCICERLSTPSDEGYARIVLRGSITLKTAVRGAVHEPLESRSEATLSQPAPQHVVNQEHQRDNRHRQHDGQQGEGHGASATPSLRSLQGLQRFGYPLATLA